MAQNAKAEAIAQRYKRTPEQLAEDIIKMEEAKNKLTQSSAELEENLRHFHEILDPICDPISGNALCWMRRPSQIEWEAMVPTELLAYKNDEDIPLELQEKYKDNSFNMMEKLIVKPQHDAQWWKENTDIVFQSLFSAHLLDVYRKLGLMTANF
jgi:hypothetical protein